MYCDHKNKEKNRRKGGSGGATRKKITGTGTGMKRNNGNIRKIPERLINSAKAKTAQPPKEGMERDKRDAVVYDSKGKEIDTSKVAKEVKSKASKNKGSYLITRALETQKDDNGNNQDSVSESKELEEKKEKKPQSSKPKPERSFDRL
jgi:hypothetical protein